MNVSMLVVPSAALLVIAGAIFGVVIARVTWADEATRASEMKVAYTKIHETDQRTIALQNETIRIMRGSQ